MRYVFLAALCTLLLGAAWISWEDSDEVKQGYFTYPNPSEAERSLALEAVPLQTGTEDSPSQEGTSPSGANPTGLSLGVLDADVSRLLSRWPVDRADIRAVGLSVVEETVELGAQVRQGGVGELLYRRRETGADDSGEDELLVERDGAKPETFTAYLTIYCCKGDPGGAYCGNTAAQVPVAEGMVACSRHFSFGTRFKIRGDTLHGEGVVCRDRGSAVTARNHLDVFFEDCGDQQDPAPGTGWWWLQRTGTQAVVEVVR